MKVALPVEVPEDKYCFAFEGESWRTICKYFNSEDGHPSCSLELYGQRRDEKGFLKSPNCMGLETIK